MVETIYSGVHYQKFDGQVVVRCVSLWGKCVCHSMVEKVRALGSYPEYRAPSYLKIRRIRVIDYIGNQINEGDTVIVAIRSGNTASLGRAFVKQMKVKPQFAGGAPSNMIEVEWSNIHRYWMPSRHVLKIPEEMLPEKRREKLNDTNEAVQPQ